MRCYVSLNGTVIQRLKTGLLNFSDYGNSAENACLFKGGCVLVRDPCVPSHKRILQKVVQLSTFMLALDK